MCSLIMVKVSIHQEDVTGTPVLGDLTTLLVSNRTNGPNKTLWNIQVSTTGLKNMIYVEKIGLRDAKK